MILWWIFGQCALCQPQRRLAGKTAGGKNKAPVCTGMVTSASFCGSACTSRDLAVIKSKSGFTVRNSCTGVRHAVQGTTNQGKIVTYIMPFEICSNHSFSVFFNLRGQVFVIHLTGLKLQSTQCSVTVII